MRVYDPLADEGQGSDCELDDYVFDEFEADEVDVDISDDEYITARERVIGCNKQFSDLAQQLQKEAAELGGAGSVGEGGVRGVVTNRGGSGDRGEGPVSDYESSYEDIHTPPTSDEGEPIQARRTRRGELVSDKSDFSIFQWKVGQRFATRGCPFKLYASWDSRRGTFVVKSVVNENTCLRNMERNRQLKSSWVAEQLLEVFKAKPHWPAKDIMQTIRLAYKVLVMKDFAYKVKYYAHKMLYGLMKDHYQKVGRAFFRSSTRCGVVTNNMAETFNGYIIQARTEHLLYMLEDIRASLMKRLAVKKQNMDDSISVICPRVQLKLEKNKDEAAKCQVLPSTRTVFQVNHYLDSLTVDLEGMT
ncbi:Calcium-transporting ATPase PAT1 [Bienertia sinuspersici]